MVDREAVHREIWRRHGATLVGLDGTIEIILDVIEMVKQQESTTPSTDCGPTTEVKT